MGSAMNEINSKVNTAGKNIEKGLSRGYNAAENAMEDAADVMNDSFKTSLSYVKENPMTGVAIAAAAGIVAGTLLTMAALKLKRH